MPGAYAKGSYGLFEPFQFDLTKALEIEWQSVWNCFRYRALHYNTACFSELLKALSNDHTGPGYRVVSYDNLSQADADSQVRPDIIFDSRIFFLAYGLVGNCSGDCIGGTIEFRHEGVTTNLPRYSIVLINYVGKT